MNYTLLLTGKMRAAKDEFAKLMLKLDPSLRRMAFADQLKAYSAGILGIPVEDLHDAEKKKLYRDRLIFGGNLVRAIAPHTWADHVYFSSEYRDNNVIITCQSGLHLMGHQCLSIIAVLGIQRHKLYFLF